MDNKFDIIDEIEEFSGNRLKRKEDLSTLIRLAYSNNINETIEELSFTAKYVLGLFRVLEQAAGNSEIQNTDRIKTDVSGNLAKVKEMIGTLIANADESTKNNFRSLYLGLSQNCLSNLIELLSDLEWTKKYLNQVKRTGRN